MIILAHYTFTVIVISIAIVKKLTIYVKKLVDLQNRFKSIQAIALNSWSCPQLPMHLITQRSFV